MSDKQPTPVHIVAPASMPVTAAEPLPVVIHEGPTAVPPAPISRGEHMTLPPTTTEQEDRVTEGQRHINRIWEYTQSAIAIFVVAASMGASVHGYVTGNQREIPNMLATAFGSVVVFYFVRTNHTQIGGVGKKPNHEGR